MKPGLQSRADARIVASIEARMSSSRLPGKMLANINGKPAIARVVERLKAVSRLDGIVVATTTNSADDPLVSWAQNNGVAVFRGSEDDVLGRVVGAQQSAASTTVVEVTGDTPLICPEVIESGIEAWLGGDADVVHNTGGTQTFPMGADVQIFALELLEDVATRISDPAIREHVSLYFYEHPERYQLQELTAPEKWQAPDVRLQLDYAEDLEFIRAVFKTLEPEHGSTFGLDPILALLKANPDLSAINRDCVEKAPR